MADPGAVAVRFSASFQGISCHKARAERTPGLESDAYSIEVPAASLAKLTWKTPSAGLFAAAQADGVGAGGAAPSGEEPPVAVGSDLSCRGDLVMRDGVGEPVAFASLYVREDGIEAVDSGDNDDGPALARIHLVDIRYFWGPRGELWGRYNVLLPDGTWDRSTLLGAEPAQGAGSTSDRDTRAPRDLLAILRLVADKLPGRPPIVKAPASVAGKTPTGLVWEGISPKRELERLLALYGLTLSLTRRNEIVLTDATEERPQDAPSGAARQVGGASLPEGAWRRVRRQAFRYRPESVRIVGPRVIREARVEMEAVGYARDPETFAVDERRLVPAGTAADSYGLALADLAKVVLLPQHMQVLWGRSKNLTEKDILALNRWAFRMFRLPKDARKLLPILPSRAKSYFPTLGPDPQGSAAPTPAPQGDGPPKPTPPLVEAEVFVEERLRKSVLARLAGAAGGTGSQGGGGGGTPENAGETGSGVDKAPSGGDSSQGGSGEGDTFGVDESAETPNATPGEGEDAFS